MVSIGKYQSLISFLYSNIWNDTKDDVIASKDYGHIEWPFYVPSISFINGMIQDYLKPIHFLILCLRFPLPEGYGSLGTTLHVAYIIPGTSHNLSNHQNSEETS